MTAVAQSGICAEARPYASFIAFDWCDGVDVPAARRALAQVPLLTQTLAAEYPQAGLCSVVAIGTAAWEQLYGRKPAQLQGFPQFGDTVIDLPVSELGGLLHIRSERHDLNFELANRIAEQLGPLVRWGEQIDGFRYLDSRDLTGFVDGTENPRGDERAEVALVGDEDAGFAGGSYLHIQRWLHNMPKWRATPVAEQEQVIGRSKQDDVEMDDEVKPPTAHIARVVIEEDGAELEILRQSMPYGRLGEMGLMFASYARSPQPFARMLAMMFRRDAAGHYDHLLNYSRPLTGAALFAPSVDFLTRMAG
ncbi:MAG: Dyp-type peroxidase [Chitinivorax sp.]